MAVPGFEWIRISRPRFFFAMGPPQDTLATAHELPIRTLTDRTKSVRCAPMTDLSHSLDIDRTVLPAMQPGAHAMDSPRVAQNVSPHRDLAREQSLMDRELENRDGRDSLHREGARRRCAPASGTSARSLAYTFVVVPTIDVRVEVGPVASAGRSNPRHSCRGERDGRSDTARQPGSRTGAPDPDPDPASPTQDRALLRRVSTGAAR